MMIDTVQYYYRIKFQCQLIDDYKNSTMMN